MSTRAPSQRDVSTSGAVAPTPVVLMARTLDLGGSERQLAEVARSLDRQRFEPWVACFDARGMRADDLRRAGVPVVEFPVRSFMAPRTARLAWQFARWLVRRRIALVHPFDFPTAVFGVPVARAARIHVVLSSQRSDRKLRPHAYQQALRVTDRLVDGIIVNSDYVRYRLRSDYGVPDHLMHTCPNGLDPSIFHARSRSRRPELPPGGYIVGTVAALRPEKRLDTLLEAFARLTELRHRLVIIGDGPCRNELATVARKLGITSRCTFVPATPDVASWYRSIDVFVLPSINESFPNSIMEAMACGCAVIASNVGGIPELISDQENGLLFDPANPADLARQLEVVLSNAAYRCALGVAAARTIQAEYTNDLAAQRFAAVYDELLSAGRR